jgi:hypothetical protein
MYSWLVPGIDRLSVRRYPDESKSLSHPSKSAKVKFEGIRGWPELTSGF